MVLVSANRCVLCNLSLLHLYTDARVHMGEIEEDSIDEKSTEVNYQAINSKTAATVIIAALDKGNRL